MKVLNVHTKVETRCFASFLYYFKTKDCPKNRIYSDKKSVKIIAKGDAKHRVSTAIKFISYQVIYLEGFKNLLGLIRRKTGEDAARAMEADAPFFLGRNAPKKWGWSGQRDGRRLPKAGKAGGSPKPALK